MRKTILIILIPCSIMKIRFIIRIDVNILFAKQRKLNGAECSLLKKAPKTNRKAIFRCND